MEERKNDIEERNNIESVIGYGAAHDED